MLQDQDVASLVIMHCNELGKTSRCPAEVAKKKRIRLLREKERVLNYVTQLTSEWCKSPD